ncbi:hypothetical protein D9756_010906 [Leucocoprinus leucothites]|uniref:Uncharacterized protein n=1 Tax=Leucocoprinus leucothites TaxID=201217 RepID=A0A8H5CQ97_9AGAR|nr:hypothetical protein D9756_010906 [Leucoagaricus leucothites]
MSATSTDLQRAFPITAAQLSGNFCETLTYGMYLVTCTFCARTLLLTGSGQEERWRRPHEIRWFMAIIAFTLFGICTFDVAIGLLHNFHAFIEADDAETEFYNIADWINISRSVNQFVAALLGDFVLIYRCWIVYGRRFLIAVPSFILYLAGIAVTIRLLEIESNPKTLRGISLNSNEIRPWYSAFFAITAAQNVLTTGILIWRIWRVEKAREKFLDQSGSTSNQPQHLRKVIRVIAESGAAYTLTVLLTFIVSISQSNAIYPVSDMSLQALGIMFNVILVRSSAKRDQQFTTFDHNERTTIIWQHSAGNTILGSIKLVPGEGGPQDVESNTSAVEDQAHTQPLPIDSAPGSGVKVVWAVE